MCAFKTSPMKNVSFCCLAAIVIIVLLPAAICFAGFPIKKQLINIERISPLISPSAIDSPGGEQGKTPELLNKLKRIYKDKAGEIEKKSWFPGNKVTGTDSLAYQPKDTTGKAQVQENKPGIFSTLQDTYNKKTAQVEAYTQPKRPLKSGIYGKLSFYMGLTSLFAIGIAFLSLSPFLMQVDAVLWLLSLPACLIFGLIGVTRRKKRGKAILGLMMGGFQVALIAAFISFLSAAATAGPVIFDVLAVLLFMGHGG